MSNIHIGYTLRDAACNVHIGYRVMFKDHVFDVLNPMRSYFESYRGHTFEVANEPFEGLAELRCVSDSSVDVEGAVYIHDLRVVSEPRGICRKDK